MANIDEMKQEAKDAKDRAKADKAYDASLTSTQPSPKPKKMAKGGVTRADGCVTKGHTRGKMV
jgi:hypothetical protein